MNRDKIQLLKTTLICRWFNYTYYPVVEGMNCCSDTAVTFHYITPGLMYVMEYRIYHLKPYGLDQKIDGQSVLNKGRFALILNQDIYIFLKIIIKI